LKEEKRGSPLKGESKKGKRQRRILLVLLAPGPEGGDLMSSPEMGGGEDSQLRTKTGVREGSGKHILSTAKVRPADCIKTWRRLFKSRKQKGIEEARLGFVGGGGKRSEKSPREGGCHQEEEAVKIWKEET